MNQFPTAVPGSLTAWLITPTLLFWNKKVGCDNLLVLWREWKIANLIFESTMIRDCPMRNYRKIRIFNRFGFLLSLFFWHKEPCCKGIQTYYSEYIVHTTVRCTSNRTPPEPSNWKRDGYKYSKIGSSSSSSKSVLTTSLLPNWSPQLVTSSFARKDIYSFATMLFNRTSRSLFKGATKRFKSSSAGEESESAFAAAAVGTTFVTYMLADFLSNFIQHPTQKVRSNKGANHGFFSRKTDSLSGLTNKPL